MEINHFLSLGVFALIGCAHPNFQDSPVPAGPPEQKAEGSCQILFPHSSLCGRILWKTGLTEKTGSIFEFMTWNPQSADSKGPFADVPDMTWRISIFMPDMGHGSSPVRLEQISSGHYQVSKLYFFMPGRWEIRFQLENRSSQVIDQFALPVDVP
jgi:hypothetical protein